MLLRAMAVNDLDQIIVLEHQLFPRLGVRKIISMNSPLILMPSIMF